MSVVGSSPALATCETSQVLLAGVPGGFSRGSPVFAHLLIGPSHMSGNNFERDVKLNLKKKCKNTTNLCAIIFSVAKSSVSLRSSVCRHGINFLRTASAVLGLISNRAMQCMSEAIFMENP